MRIFALTFCILTWGTSFTSIAQDKPAKMPRENVVDTPAIGDELCVSNVFQSNMVLQRDKTISIWGWAAPGERVTVEFAGKSADTTAQADRSWKLSLPAMAANDQPQKLTIRGKDKSLILENILIGDIWVLGGQSNMEFSLDRIENGQLEIVSANYPKIRILTIPAANGPDEKKSFPRLHEWSGWFSRHFRKGDWDECTPEVAKELSAIGFVFARRIHKATNVPIGVIDASRGGTTVETWTPDPILRKLKSDQVNTLLSDWDAKVAAWDSAADLKNRVENYRKKVERFKKEGRKLGANDIEPTDLRPGPAMDQNRPGNCYASMIAPLEGLQIKGAIFHQGYNNCFNGTEGAIMYRQIFPEMIRSWRSAFEDKNLPFGILSLCTEGAVQTMDNFCEMMANPGPFIREAQYQTFLDLYKAGDKNIGFTSTYDLRRRWYHPQLKIPAGERIARWALATQYGFERSIRWKPPIIKETKVESDRIVITFDEAVAAIDDGSPIVGFAIAGADGRFQPAEANHLVIGKDNRGRDRKDTRSLVLSSPLVKLPQHFRYAWARSPLGNLQAQRQSDVPIGTQRSDKFTLENTPPNLFEDPVKTKLDRGQRRKQTEALKEMDRQRKLFEARELLKTVKE